MDPSEQSADSPVMAITIGRQLGSGGAELGQRIARRVGAAYLDQEILRTAAKQLGVAHQSLADRQECVTRFWERLLRAFAIGAPDETYTAYHERAQAVPSIPDEELFNAQSQAMRELVKHGDSVVIGHAGFYVLRDHPCHVRVFVHARADLRAKRISQERQVSLAEARGIVRQADEDRRLFVQRLASCDWTNVRNYDLCIDSGRVSSDLAEELIVHLVEERRQQCAVR